MEMLEKSLKFSFLPESEYQENSSHITDLHRKSTLLEAHSAECKVDIARYDEYNKRLNDRLQEYQQPQM